MDNILNQLYIQSKDGMIPIFVNSKCIEVNNLENVTEEFLNDNYSEYNKIIDKGNGNVYEQYEIGKWSGIKSNIPVPDEYVFTSDKSNISFIANGGSNNVDIISTKNGVDIVYTVTYKPDWVSFENGYIYANKNDSENSRNDIILLTQYESEKTITITINQAGTIEDIYELDANPTSINIGIDGGIENVNVTSSKNGNFVMVDIENKPDWINIQNIQTIDNIMKYKLAINKNEDYNSRTGIITIKQTESGRTVNVTVNQEGTDNYTFSVTPVVAVMNADGSTTINATVTSIKNDAVQGFSLNNKSDWLNVTINDGAVTITAEQYTGSDLYRSGSVSFIQNESGKVCGINITQSYSNRFEINGASIQNVDYNRLETTVGVTSIVNRQPADFTVESISADWVTANPVSVAGNKRLHVVISKNVDSNPRTCTITCKQTDTGAIATTTITQGRSPYELNVRPSEINIDGSSQNSIINIESLNGGEEIGVTIDSIPDWISATLIDD